MHHSPSVRTKPFIRIHSIYIRTKLVMRVSLRCVAQKLLFVGWKHLVCDSLKRTAGHPTARSSSFCFFFLFWKLCDEMRSVKKREMVSVCTPVCDGKPLVSCYYWCCCLNGAVLRRPGWPQVFWASCSGLLNPGIHNYVPPNPACKWHFKYLFFNFSFVRTL